MPTSPGGLSDPDLLQLSVGSAEPLTITNYRDELQPLTTPKARTALVKAAVSRDSRLNEDALHTIARAVVSPDAAAMLIRDDLMVAEAIGPIDISMLSAQLFLTELLPLMQPRAGGYSYDVASPRIMGVIAESGAAPMIRVLFESEDHLRSFTKQTIVQTRALGQDYSNSILAKKVSRPVLTHVVEICFADGSDSFMAMVVRDGITRVVSSWATIYPGLDASALADVVVDTLLRRGTSKAAGATETMLRARGRESENSNLRVRFALGTAESKPTEDAIRISQTFTLPGQVCIDLGEVGRSPVAPEQQFEDTIQAVIASVHGEFRPWDASATQAASIQRAVTRAVHDDCLDPQVADLALGLLPVESMPKIFSNSKPPATPLWRAVYLMSWLSNPTEFANIKKHLRDLTGSSRITNKAYVGHLATLIDGPWRRAKAHSERTARRAWQNGGPMPNGMLGAPWDPVPTEDFRLLVPRALEKDLNARMTLQVAGGVALIADKILMSNTGSGVDSGAVPFRADVDDVIAGLGNSEEGLYLLAHAANAFRPDAKAVNSFTKTDITSTPSITDGAYTVPRPQKGAPKDVERDAGGALVALTPYDVVFASNPARAAASEASKEQERRQNAGSEETAPERATRLRAEASAHLEDALTTVRALVEVASKDGAVGNAFGSKEAWDKLNNVARSLQKVLWAHEPDANDEAGE